MKPRGDTPPGLWQESEGARGAYRVALPTDGLPAALRVAPYYRDDDGRFVNSRWLALPL